VNFEALCDVRLPSLLLVKDLRGKDVVATSLVATCEKEKRRDDL
jgi:hypothetical protein